MPGRRRFAEPVPRAAVGFRPEFLDFKRGIRVGNLEDHERITRLLKTELEARYRQGFVTERWGRGVFWQWIAFLPRANREAKPLSSKVSFGCSKFFISVDTELERELKRLVVREGFRIFAGGWDAASKTFSKANFQTAALRRALARAEPNHWAGFQLYYPMTEEEVRGSTGVDLLESMLAVFEEVRPLMNLCQQVRI